MEFPAGTSFRYSQYFHQVPGPEVGAHTLDSADRTNHTIGASNTEPLANVIGNGHDPARVIINSRADRIAAVAGSAGLVASVKRLAAVAAIATDGEIFCRKSS